MVVLLLIVLILYFVPSFVAAGRGHGNLAAIFILNLFLGWSILGWVAALVWSFGSAPAIVISQSPAVNAIQSETRSDMKACPRCAEDIKAAAAICRFCGFEFVSAE